MELNVLDFVHRMDLPESRCEWKGHSACRPTVSPFLQMMVKVNGPHFRQTMSDGVSQALHAADFGGPRPGLHQ